MVRVAPDEDVIARLVKKTLFIGVFAYIINNWTNLARIVFESFAGLGLKASGTGLHHARIDQRCEQLQPEPPLRPAVEAIIDRRRRTVSPPGSHTTGSRP